MSGVDAINEVIAREAPALWSALSPLGRACFYPPDIPFQAAQARGKRFNATIGQITDGAGRILPLPSIAEALGGFADEDLNRALLYSPIDGLPELRERWHAWHRPAGDAVPPSSLPVVTCGLTHGLAIAADLFGGPGRMVVVPSPFWGNYRQVFGLRTGATILPAPAYDEERRWVPTAIADAMTELPAGEPVVALLNVPSNPGGYSPTESERRILVQSLIRAAEQRPLVVVCDDAYSGLVFEPDIPKSSLFWELIGAHPNLVPIRLAGSTKEFVFFGGRVGFVTFPWASGTPLMDALENKVRGLIRAGVGSPTALSQITLLQAMRRDDAADQVRDVVEVMAERYRVLRAALEQFTDPALFRVLPFNSGVFAVLELAPGRHANEARLELLESQDVGLVSIGDRFLRIAFCSIDKDSIPELVERTVAGLREIAARDRSRSASVSTTGT
ncbi:MAG TPA: aminotransferase class I/II-fold pyridoxal phosphate-dependent enzyme [Thermoanaerobaculia bacterium]|nr:aminotransferase class I/II-fold pyridoxal phosphate-dependent enzyme [Thermoanaerobaculia bacterium]